MVQVNYMTLKYEKLCIWVLIPKLLLVNPKFLDTYNSIVFCKGGVNIGQIFEDSNWRDVCHVTEFQQNQNKT